ncbi:MAG: flavodoxin family protein [Desulfobacterales bacterium]|nr:MAG: flavodoxin family protein [Desulfobacterales bacterium]
MKALIVYSTMTGNTRKLAEAALEVLPADALAVAVEDAPDPAEFDFVIVGFWLKAGKPDPKSADYLKKAKGHKNLFLFATHGARPGSDHAENAMRHAVSLAEGARVSGTFGCFGEVDPGKLEMVKAKPQPPVWLADAPDAAGHPDAADLENLKAALRAAMG